MTATADTVLRVWFGDDLETPEVVDDRSRLWFASEPKFDELIQQQFGTMPERAHRGEFLGWTAVARSTLALVLVLDQFPRNLYRNTAKSFAFDAEALNVSREALVREVDSQLHPLEAAFIYLPFEHAEDRAVQAESVSLFRSLIDRAPPRLFDRFEAFAGYAERHQKVIEKFGRFPHRNAALGRVSTAAELEYLELGGETFSETEGADE